MKFDVNNPLSLYVHIIDENGKDWIREDHVFVWYSIAKTGLLWIRFNKEKCEHEYSDFVLPNAKTVIRIPNTKENESLIDYFNVKDHDIIIEWE